MRMRTRSRSRTTIAGWVSLLAFLLTVGTAPFALAANDWPTWPPKKEGPASPGGEAASTAGAADGQSTFAGISTGTLGWGAAFVGAAVLIGVAAGGSGGSSNTSSTCTP